MVKPRVLSISEYASLRFELTPVYKLVCDSMLHTRMDYTELIDFLEHPYQYSAATRTITNGRTIHLARDGCNAVEVLKAMPTISIPEPQLVSTIYAFAQSANIPTEGIGSQTFRNTGIAWLLALYPKMAASIASQSGFKATRNLRDNGLEVEFGKRDIDGMAIFFDGWMVKK